MKWLLLSDPQFDEQWSYSRPGPDGGSVRLKDQIDMLDWAFDVAKATGCQGFLTLGDVFDSRTELSLPVIDAVCTAYRRRVALAREEHGEFRLGFLVGNHDAYLRNASVTSLRVFDGYADVVSSMQVIDKFALVPWCDNRDKYIGMLGAAEKTKAQFLFSHGIIKGTIPDPNIGYDVTLFNPPRWKSVWMGDVHGACSPAKNVHYVGAPMQHHFGDAGGQRGVVVLDDVTGAYKRVWNEISPQFHIVRTADEAATLLQRDTSRDFIRVEIPDPAESASAAHALRARCAWVEAPALEVEGDAAPRIDLKTAVSDMDVLKRYCAFKGVEDPDYVAMGASILKESGQ